MAKKQRDRSGLTDSSKVQQLLTESRRSQEAQRTDGRGRAGHAGQRGRDKRGHEKVTYYLPLDRQNLVREIASQEDVSQTDIVEAAVVALYNAWRSGKVDLEELKSPARSLKVSWKLNILDEFGFFSD